MWHPAQQLHLPFKGSSNTKTMQENNKKDAFPLHDIAALCVLMFCTNSIVYGKDYG